MRNQIVTSLVLFSSMVVCAQQAPAPAKPATIQGSGCVEKAVESSCLVLKDAKTGDLYNVMFAGNAPASGTPIKFKGVEHQGMTTCMQGKAVNVTKWKKVKGQNCPTAPAEAAH